MKNLSFLLMIFLSGISTWLTAGTDPNRPIRVQVVTGGHDYDQDAFDRMLAGLGNEFTFQVSELPGAFEMFQPQNRNRYDVLLFYHMWQDIDSAHMKALAACISEGKPLVALHHSICAFTNWDEYLHIIGGKYLHHYATIKGTEYPASSYEHDRQMAIQVIDTLHPVSIGISNFILFDETYLGYYVEPGVTPLLQTDDPTSTPVIAWTKRYGKSRVVSIQPGHGVPAFEDESYRKLLRQAIVWVNEGDN